MEQPNLTYINQISGNDPAFKKKLIAIIKTEFPKEKNTYHNNAFQKKKSQLAENVHKLKHKISILGLEKGYIIANDYENNLKNNSYSLKNEFDAILDCISQYIKTL